MPAVKWPTANIEMSSVNSTVTIPWRHVGRLYTNNEKRMGLRTDPSGMPEVTVR